MNKKQIIERFIRRIKNITEALSPDQIDQVSKMLQGLNLDPASLTKINTTLGIPTTAPGGQQQPTTPMGNGGGTTVAGKGVTPGSTVLGTGATPGASAKIKASGPGQQAQGTQESLERILHLSNIKRT